MIKRQIIAMGGGGFSMEPNNPLLDLYILKQSGKDKPKVCFIPTASGDSQNYIDRFYQSFEKHHCTPSHLSLFRGQTAAIEDVILEQDILYVGGGNTRNLLTLWKDWKLDQIIRKAYENGTVLAGISAGSICWFEQGVTDSIPGQLTSLKCLGWLKGSNCPHYDGETERRPAYHRLMLNNEILPGVATDDGAAAHSSMRNFIVLSVLIRTKEHFSFLDEIMRYEKKHKSLYFWDKLRRPLVSSSHELLFLLRGRNKIRNRSPGREKFPFIKCL